MKANEFNRYIKGIAQKDGSSFNKLYDYYYPKIVVHVNCKYKTNIGEDIAQQFFMSLHNAPLTTYVQSPDSYVMAAVDNIAKKYFIKDSYIPVGLDKFDNISDACSTPNEDTVVAESLLDRLDEDTKRIMVLRYWCDYKFEDIACLLGESRASVSKKFERGIKKLTEFVKKGETGGKR